MDNNNQNPYTLDFSANETTESQETSINEKKNIDVVVADASLVGKTCPFCKTDIKEGDEIIVMCMGYDKRGRLNFSRKAAIK